MEDKKFDYFAFEEYAKKYLGYEDWRETFGLFLWQRFGGRWTDEFLEQLRNKELKEM